ncbi:MULTISPECIES: hypothetical protein [Streptomyces]|uniref:hypothetical protein n=1 Tax=Streptomyces TaxID=1883 RepID=UPI0004CCC2E6|nr:MULTISPECIES: hypothetical protein [Streptomyces]KOT48401.1 hypothetical protein ADK43_38115 [Streptomyces rimosus subsp. rimosus]
MDPARAAVLYICQPGPAASADSSLDRLNRHARQRLHLVPQKKFHDSTDPQVACDDRPHWRDNVKKLLETATAARPRHLVVPSMHHIAPTCAKQREVYRWAHTLGVAVHCADPPAFSARDFLGDALDVLVRLEEVHRISSCASRETVLAACGVLRQQLNAALPPARQRLQGLAGPRDFAEHVRLQCAITAGEALLFAPAARQARTELRCLIHGIRALLPPELTGPWNDPWTVPRPPRPAAMSAPRSPSHPSAGPPPG